MTNLSAFIVDLLPDWELVDRSAETLSLRCDAPIAGPWPEPISIAPSCDDPRTYCVTFGEIAKVVISFTRQQIELFQVTASVPPETIEHLLVDQIVPRIMAEQGDFVLHASAVEKDGSALIFAGATGRGKSTLSASLHKIGCKLLSDDAILLTTQNQAVLAQGVYPSLRMYADTARAVLGEQPKLSLMAHYSDKMRVSIEEAQTEPLASLPASALFLLGAESASDEIGIKKFGEAEACIQMIDNSFALDPGNRAGGRKRFEAAAGLAQIIPVYELHFPRDYRRLPDLHTAIFRELETHQ